MRSASGSFLPLSGPQFPHLESGVREPQVVSKTNEVFTGLGLGGGHEGWLWVMCPGFSCSSWGWLVAVGWIEGWMSE